MTDLAVLAGAYDLDVRDLESGLIRLDLAHGQGTAVAREADPRGAAAAICHDHLA